MTVVIDAFLVKQKVAVSLRSVPVSFDFAHVPMKCFMVAFHECCSCVCALERCLNASSVTISGLATSELLFTLVFTNAETVTVIPVFIKVFCVRRSRVGCSSALVIHSWMLFNPLSNGYEVRSNARG